MTGGGGKIEIEHEIFYAPTRLVLKQHCFSLYAIGMVYVVLSKNLSIVNVS